MAPTDPFSAAPAATSAKYPAFAQLGSGAKKVKALYAPGTDDEQNVDTTGRLCIFRPVDLEKNVPSRFKGVPPSDRMKVDIVVLDGEPIVAVLDKDGDVTYTFETPLTPSFELKAMFVSQKLVVDQLSDAFRDGGMVLGRIVKLPPKSAGGNKAWAIGNFTDADREKAMAYMAAHPVADPFSA
jgi:hypothetical protein